MAFSGPKTSWRYTSCLRGRNGLHVVLLSALMAWSAGCGTTTRVPPSGSPSTENVDTLVTQARDAMARREPQVAIELLIRARELNPDHPELLFLFGRAYQAAGVDGAAYLAYAEYLARPEVDEQHKNQSRAALGALGATASAPLTRLLRDLSEEKRAQDALELILLVQRYDNTFPVIGTDFRRAGCQFLGNLAAAAFEAEKVLDAEKIAQHAISLTPQCPFAFAIAARSAVVQGDRQRAAKLFSDGLAANPRVLLFHRDLAVLYRGDGDFERAILHLQTYLSEDLEDEERAALHELLNETQQDARLAKWVTSATGEATLPRRSGTAFLVTSDGLALTAAHVVANATRIWTIRSDGTASVAAVVEIDEDADVAVLQLPATGTPLPLSSRAPQVGTHVFTLGYPDIAVLGVSPKLSEGIISSVGGPMDAPELMQISVPIQPGNSGGPVLDENGAAVGMVVGRMLPGTYENVSFAVKAERLQAHLPRGLLPRRRTSKRRPQPLQDTANQTRKSILMVLAW